MLGNAADPGDNIKLGNDRSKADWVAGQRTTLSGTVGTMSVDLITPTLGDWTADGLILAYGYVTAALASLGKTPADWNDNAIPGVTVTFDEAVAEFVFGTTTPTTSGAFVISDPNLSYAYSSDGTVILGLAGNLDAQFLNPLLPFVGIVSGTVPIQASEVVRLTTKTQTGDTIFDNFVYSFSATASGDGASNCYDGDGDPNSTCSYSGNYEIPVPAPAALLALGLMGLTFARRTNA